MQLGDPLIQRTVAKVAKSGICGTTISLEEISKVLWNEVKKTSLLMVDFLYQLYYPTPWMLMKSYNKTFRNDKIRKQEKRIITAEKGI